MRASHPPAPSSSLPPSPALLALLPYTPPLLPCPPCRRVLPPPLLAPLTERRTGPDQMMLSSDKVSEIREPILTLDLQIAPKPEVRHGLQLQSLWITPYSCNPYDEPLLQL